MGDTSPNLPQPPASGGGGCGGLGQILMVVVAVVVAVYAPQMLANSIPGLFAGAGEVGIGVAGYAAGAAAGSIASQLVGNAIGAVDGFNWQSVALAAISAGATAGLGGGDLLGTTTGTLSNAMVRAAVSNAMSQGIGVVVGLQPSFDWRSVAASAIGAGVGFGVSEGLGLTSNGQLTNNFSGFDKFSRAALTGFAAGATTAMARGGTVSIQQVASDAFGNALGNSIADALRPQNSAQQRFRLDEIRAQNAQAQTDMSGAQAAFRADEIAKQNRNTATEVGLGSGYIPSGNSYQYGELGSGTFGADLPLSPQVQDMLTIAEGDRMLTAQRDADIDAALAAQQAQVRQAQTARAAAVTTAANVGTSPEQAGAVYMAAGGRGRGLASQPSGILTGQSLVDMIPTGGYGQIPVSQAQEPQGFFGKAVDALDRFQRTPVGQILQGLPPEGFILGGIKTGLNVLGKVEGIAAEAKGMAAGANNATLRTGTYGSLVDELQGTGLQANHLNQKAAFPIIPTDEGIAVGMRGNAFTEIGSPHFEFHSSLEGFWNQYRKGGTSFGTYPTNAQYGEAVTNALNSAGLSSAEASRLSALAAQNRSAFGLLENQAVPRIPGRLPQAKP